MKGMVAAVLAWLIVTVVHATSPVRLEGSRFVQGDKEVVPVGINYFPAYFPAIMPASWLDAAHYRRELVANDLATIQRLGINLVSIQGLNTAAPPSKLDCANLVGFLDLAHSHGLLVNLYIGVTQVVPIMDIKALTNVPAGCNLSGHPALFAYDIAWEPTFGNYTQRGVLQTLWLHWLIANYGSKRNAEVAFQSTYDMPTDQELCSEAVSVRVAAFRRFLDDTLSHNYRDVRAALLSVDSTHLIGVRSGYGGNGSRLVCDRAPVDLRAGTKHLDFVSPEAYALSLTNMKDFFSRGAFTAAYGDVGKPIFWAEFGGNADHSCLTCTESVQAEYLANMFALMRETVSNGGAAWWYVGVRPQSNFDRERSDYGIVYDYIKYPTATDSFGSQLRDGWLSFCTMESEQYGLYVRDDDVIDGNDGCPDGMFSRGRFRVGSGRTSDAHAIDKDGRTVAAGWATVCGRNAAAQLISSANGARDAKSGCAQGEALDGVFRPGAAAKPFGDIAVDAFGHAVKSGEIALCNRSKSIVLKWTHDEMSGRDLTCPVGMSNVGSFKPSTLPVFRPAAKEFKGALSGVSAAQRRYSRWIVADRDSAAGDWKMYDTGAKAFAAGLGNGERIGVHTTCYGTTSSDVISCVGNAPYNGACPPKCLNAEWNSVLIKSASGAWQTVQDNDRVLVRAGTPVVAKLSIGNIGEATWLSRSSVGGVKGSVRFGCRELVGDVSCRKEVDNDLIIFADVDSGEVQISPGIFKVSKVVFQMVSEQVAWFGEQRAVELVPQ